MNILYICYHNPFGTKGGGVMASHAYLRACCDIAQGKLDLMCASYIKDFNDNSMNISKVIYVQERPFFKKLMSPITGYMSRYVDFAITYLKKHSDLYDVVIFDHSCIGGPLVRFVNSLGKKTITIHHNYEREYFEDNNSWLRKKFFLRHVIKWEKLAYCNSDLNLFLTSQDKDKFACVYGKSIGKNRVIGVYEFSDYCDISASKSIYFNKQLTFAITGSLSTYQTNDAIQYFFDELYDCLPSDSHVLIAGRNPTDKVISLCAQHSNVTLIPNPDNINDVLADVDIYLCATRIGGGLKLRVMDGLKNGIPVITHVCSARGFDAFYDLDVFKVYSSPEEFKNAVDSIIFNLAHDRFDRNSIKHIYRDNFSYEAGLKRMRLFLSDI